MRFIAPGLFLIANIAYKIHAAPTIDQNPCDYNIGDGCSGVSLFEWQCCANGQWYACEPGIAQPVILNFFSTSLKCVGGFLIHCDDIDGGCDLNKALPFQ